MNKKTFQFDIKKAFSMVELMISISVMVILALALTVTISKKSAYKLADSIGGELTCYKDKSGNLHQKTVLYFNGGKTTEKDEVVTACKYTFPSNNSTKDATIYLIGGGGGGGGLVDVTGQLPYNASIPCDNMDDYSTLDTNCKRRKNNGPNYWFYKSDDATFKYSGDTFKALTCKESPYYYYDEGASSYADVVLLQTNTAGHYINRYKEGSMQKLTFDGSVAKTQIYEKTGTHTEDKCENVTKEETKCDEDGENCKKITKTETECKPIDVDDYGWVSTSINVNATKEPPANNVENLLRKIMSDAAYNEYILKSYNVSVYSSVPYSNTSNKRYTTVATSAKVGKSFICYNGVDSFCKNNGLHEICVSPTPGIVKYDTGDGNISVHKQPGSSWYVMDNNNPIYNWYWGNLSSTPGYGWLDGHTNDAKSNYGRDNTNYNTAAAQGPISSSYPYAVTSIPEPDNITYQSKIIDKVKLSYGRAGSPGQTYTVTNLNVSGVTVNISKNDIGNGGQAGLISTDNEKCNGSNGGETKVTINKQEYKANGGAGGSVVLEEIQLDDIKEADKIAKTPEGVAPDEVQNQLNGNKNYKMTTYSTSSDLSDYVSTYIATTAASQQNLKMQPTTCNTETKTCTSPKRPEGNGNGITGIGFGTGGGGINSLIKYNPIFRVAMYKTKNSTTKYVIICNNNNPIGTSAKNNQCAPQERRPKLILAEGNKTRGNDGISGAVIIKWGTGK